MTTGRINQVAIVVGSDAQNAPKDASAPRARTGETPDRPRKGEDGVLRLASQSHGGSRRARAPEFLRAVPPFPPDEQTFRRDRAHAKGVREAAPACRPTERENRPGKLQRTGSRGKPPKRPPSSDRERAEATNPQRCTLGSPCA